MAEKVDIIDIDLSKLKKEVKETSKTVNDLQDDLSDLQLELKSSGKSANTASQSAENLSDSLDSTGKSADNASNDINELSQSVDNLKNSTEEYESVQMDSLEIMENTTLIAAGFTGAIQAVEGAINLMGIESEEVTETIAKMQSIMAITDGLRAIAEGVKAYKALNAVLRSSAVVKKIVNALTIKEAASTTAAAAAQGGYTLATKLATAATRKFNSVLKKNPLLFIVSMITTAVVAIGELADAWGDAADKEEEAKEKAKAAAEEWKLTIQEFQESMRQLMKRNAAIGRSAYVLPSEIMQAQGARTLDVLKQQNEEYKAQIAAALAARKRFAEENSRYIKIIQRNGVEELITIAGTPQRILDEFKSLTEDVVRLREAQRDTYKAMFLEEVRLAKEAADKEIEIARERRENRNQILKEIEEDEKKLVRLQEVRELGQYDKYAKERSADLEDAASYYRERLVIYKKAQTDGLITEAEYNNIRLKMEREYGLQREEIVKKYDDLIAEEDKAARQARIDALAQEFEEMREFTNQFYSNLMNELAISGNNIGVAQLGQEMMQDIILQYETQISLFEKMGISTEDLKLQLGDAKNALAQFINDETIAKLDETRALIQGAADSFNELNSIASGVSDQWSAVFDSMMTGLDRVQSAVEKGGKGWTKYGQMASAGLHVASSMMLAIADEQNESTEEGFEKQKKLQIAAATMSMLGGIIDAWTSAMSPANKWMTIWGQVAAGSVTSAMIAATGAMQIKAIKRQKMDGSGGDAGSPIANPALSALTNLGQGVNATTEIEGASTEGKVEDQRVYVVESDITNTQNSVKTSVNEATY